MAREAWKTKADKAYRQKTKKVKQEFYHKVGDICLICDSTKRLVCHRKDFKKHICIACLSIRQIGKERTEDYVRLCFECHYGVHWAHNYLKLSWKEIVKCLS